MSKRVYRKKAPYTKPKSSEKVVRKVVKQELKKEIEVKNFFARSNPIQNPQSSGISLPMLYDPGTVLYLTQGITRNNYIGDTITPTRMRVNYVCTGTVPAGSTYTFRVLLVQAKGGGSPSPVNVLQSVGNQMTPWSFKDPSYEDTFNILYSKMHTISNADQLIAKGMIDIPQSRLRRVNFLGASAASTTNNNIFLIVYSDSTTVNPLFGYQSCLSYKDA